MMAYANQFVASIIHKNLVQREFNKNGERTVVLPFDTEYIIRVQNKHFLKASVDVLIDGISIFSAGKTLLLEPGQTINVERFVDDLKSGRKFKFVSKETATREGHQDPTSSDFGAVSIVFTPQKITLSGGGLNTLFDAGWTSPPRSAGILRGSSLSSASSSSMYCSVAANSLPNSVVFDTTSTLSVSPSNCVNTTSVKSLGGTVEGSESKQTFQQSNEVISWDYGNSTTIKMRLVGEVKEESPFPNNVFMENKYYSFQWLNKNPDGSITVSYK